MNFIKKVLGTVKTFSMKVWKMFLDQFRDKGKRKTILAYLILPFVLVIVIESFGSEKLLGGITYLGNHPIPFFCNYFIILLTLCISLFFRRRLFLVSFISFLWLVLAFSNFVLLTKRVTPFTATDILLWQPALKVVTKYYSGLVIGIVIAIIVVVLAGIIILGIKAPKTKNKVNYIRSIIITVIVAVSTYGSINLAIENNYLKVKFENIANAFLEYGFPYCFANSVFNTGVRKPTNYSSENISGLLDCLADGTEVESNIDGIMPNIIFVQLESFFDVSRMNNVVLSENPIPNFTELLEKYPSGFLNIPTVGAGTANTEFEILTGMNLDDFGPGEYPYKTVLQSKTCESIAYNLTENGYVTHAIHNNDGTFYQRHNVYSHLGFHSFTPIEYIHMDGRYTYRGWAKDEVLVEEIMKCLTVTEEKDFVFTVSVEGHGSYPARKVLEEPRVEVLEYQGNARKNSVEYFMNLLKEMDDFVGDLTKTLEENGENTIVVFYGDHLPSLDIKNEELSAGDTLQTEYVIWSNFNYQSEDEDIYSYQLASKICGILGIDTGLINKHHQLNKSSETYYSDLQTLEYDILEGKLYLYGGINPYIPTPMRMGVYDVKITDVFKNMPEGIDADEREDFSTIIKGEHFTEFSVVFINGNKVDKGDTRFLDPNTIQIHYENLIPGDSITVGQAGDDNVVLGSTEEYIYE